MRVLSRITTALDENRLVLCYQPIIQVCAVHDGSQHCEILVRMINADGAPVQPAQFIPAGERYRDQTARYEIVPQSMCFEITETAAGANIQGVSDFLWGLRLDGFRFTLDGFDMGMSSFSYLKSLPVDYVKIDGEFVKNILNDKVSLAMTGAITRVVSMMGIQTVAEYVENTAILEKLREIGVGYAQGYGVSKPILLEELSNVSPLAELRIRKQQLG